jgi:tetratricopeptide (TPR) repeat protein
MAAITIALVVGCNNGLAQDSRVVCFSDSSPGAVIPACDDLIDIDPSHAQAFQARGMGWYKLGDYERAIADFSASIRIDPKYIRAYFNRALAWEAEGKLQNALKDLRTFQFLDPSLPDTQEAIARVEKRLKTPTALAETTSTSRSGEEVVKMQPVGGVLVLPVRFNETITLNAIVDSGASDVSVPADIVLTLMRSNTVTESDFLGEKTYVLADGSKVPSRQFRIKSLRVGNKTLQNVVATVASINADILLGQSFLSKFRSWSIDNENPRSTLMRAAFQLGPGLAVQKNFDCLL